MAEISVCKLSVKDYLKSGAQNKFLITDYQRPYSWTVDEISTLWDDILTLFEEGKNSDYFWGTVVTYKNDDNENEIIDGQQRTTSLLLLLRAIYTTLEQSERTDVTGLRKDIEECLWEVNRTSGEPNKDNCLITSKVATDEHNEEFINILKTGNANTSDNNYAKNYGFFVEKVKDETTKNPADWVDDLCSAILDRIILLPIECDDQDTALTIFSTLNDRGMSLYDADIFIAKISIILEILRRKFQNEYKRTVTSAIPQARTGVSVTQRIKKIKQPRGGYINPKSLQITQLNGGIDELNSNENVHASLTGLAVDYLTRFLSSGGELRDLAESFGISLKGAIRIGEEDKAVGLLKDIKGLDDQSITNAVKLSGFDVVFRAGPMGYRPVDEINPDNGTIQNIRIMVNRSLEFLHNYGPKIQDGFTFEGGYTDVVSTGDGDFITDDTLWDFKVSKLPPKSEHTLQLLMYWRMGIHSNHSEFTRIKNLGIFNPRLNVVYKIATSEIPNNVILEVESEVIGYNSN